MPRRTKEEDRIYAAQYYAKHREERLLYAKNKSRGISPVMAEKLPYCPVRNRKAALKYRYNITIEDYDTLFLKQEGKCAICGIQQQEYKKTFHVDHNHSNGKVRGLLCSTCNTHLGIFEKNQEQFNSYLKTREV